jgi:hypothetical protein
LSGPEQCFDLGAVGLPNPQPFDFFFEGMFRD